MCVNPTLSTCPTISFSSMWTQFLTLRDGVGQDQQRPCSHRVHFCVYACVCAWYVKLYDSRRAVGRCMLRCGGIIIITWQQSTSLQWHIFMASSNSLQLRWKCHFFPKSIFGVLEPLALPICKVHLLGLLSPTLRDNRVGVSTSQMALS